MTRRTARLAAAYLLLGVMVSLGGALWFWHADHPPRWPRGRYGWSELRYGYNTHDDTQIVCVGNTGCDALLIQRGPFVRTAEVGNWPPLPVDHTIPDWVTAHAESAYIGYRGYAMMYGLPWRSMAAPPMPDEAAIYPDSPRPFPTKLLWPGLIADTLFYALLFAGLHQLAGWRRRTRRRRRGRCAACGYDLTGIDGVCPECGGVR